MKKGEIKLFLTLNTGMLIILIVNIINYWGVKRGLVIFYSVGIVLLMIMMMKQIRDLRQIRDN